MTIKSLNCHGYEEKRIIEIKRNFPQGESNSYT
jgi:hypothetical protein